MTFGRNLHPFVLRNAYDAVEIARENPVEGGFKGLRV
jgi:hypothetical protein